MLSNKYHNYNFTDRNLTGTTSASANSFLNKGSLIQKLGTLKTSVELVSTIHFIFPSRQTNPALDKINSAVAESVSHAL